MAKKPKKKKEDQDIAKTREDYTSARSLWNEVFPEQAKPLPQLDATRPTETQNMLNLRAAYADPNNASFAGRLDPDTKAMLQKMQAQQDPTSGTYAGIIDPKIQAQLLERGGDVDELGRLSPEVREMLARRKGDMDTAGLISPETRALLDTRRGQMGAAGQNSADITDIIGRFKEGLAGYDARENQALREQAARGINQQYASASRSAIDQGARSGVRGAARGAAQANLDRNRLNAQQEMEQGLFVKNADEKQNRLKTYADYMRDNAQDLFNREQEATRGYEGLLTGSEDTAYKRGTEAEQAYQGLLGDSENTAYNRRRQAQQDYQDLLLGSNDTAYRRAQDAQSNYYNNLTGANREMFGRGQGAIQSWQDLLGTTQDKELGVSQFNLGQLEKDRAANLAGVGGIAGDIMTRRNQRRQNKLL